MDRAWPRTVRPSNGVHDAHNMRAGSFGMLVDTVKYVAIVLDTKTENPRVGGSILRLTTFTRPGDAMSLRAGLTVSSFDAGLRVGFWMVCLRRPLGGRTVCSLFMERWCRTVLDLPTLVLFSLQESFR